ncbi:MAG: hypothetical protein KC549_13200, partial [Myxococcales bacterium]|nr:hypothetical protein [Myxococcales bacterium]
MGWRFWRRRSSTEVEAAEQLEHDAEVGVDDEADDEAIEELAVDELGAELDEPAPRISKFTFERPPLPPGADTEVVRSMPAAAEEPPHVRVERVVRSKAAGRRSGTDLRSRGVGPVWVPGLLEIATSYRLAAEARMDDPAGAREFWNAYLELCPEDAEAWFAFGQLLLGERRFEQAWTSFEAAHRHDGGNGLAAGALGFL